MTKPTNIPAPPAPPPVTNIRGGGDIIPQRPPSPPKPQVRK